MTAVSVPPASAPSPNPSPAPASGPSGGVPPQEPQPPAQPPVAQPKPANEPPPKAPASYTFKTPDGQDYDPEVSKEFGEIARGLNLGQDKAQEVLNRWAKFAVERQQRQGDTARTQWAEQLRADKEFGGDKLSQTISNAEKFFEAFGDPELRQLLKPVSAGGEGLGGHPALVRWAARAFQKLMAEDRVVPGSTGQGNGVTGPLSFEQAAKRMYPSTS